jgi:hypothetical protein
MRKEGNLIKDIIWAKGLTLKEISEELGVSYRVLQQKLGGDRGFKLREINFLCDKLEKTYEELFRKNDKVKTS